MDDSSQTALNWWLEKRLMFPVPYKAACIDLAVPSSSGSSERVFSAAGNIVTKNRNRCRIGQEPGISSRVPRSRMEHGRF